MLKYSLYFESPLSARFLCCYFLCIFTVPLGNGNSNLHCIPFCFLSLWICPVPSLALHKLIIKYGRRSHGRDRRIPPDDISSDGHNKNCCAGWRLNVQVEKISSQPKQKLVLSKHDEMTQYLENGLRSLIIWSKSKTWEHPNCKSSCPMIGRIRTNY